MIGLLRFVLAFLLTASVAGAQTMPSPVFDHATQTGLASNAALKAALLTNVTAGSVVHRSGFATAGDGGAADYVYSTAACSLNLGAGDNGSQVQPTSGPGCWLAKFPMNILNVRVFGAKGDGSTPDSTAIQNAINAAEALSGGSVVIPPTGAAYVINTGLTITTAGVKLVGTSGGFNWLAANHGTDNTEANWTGKGSWFHCTDTVNTCIKVDVPGSTVEGINYWYTQPTPVNGTNCATPCTWTHAWTPTIYPYTITVGNTAANFTRLRNINIVNATHCIDWEGPSTGIAGIYSSMEHMSLGCFVRGTKFHLIDNVITVDDVHYETWWYQGSSDVYGYIQGTGQQVCQDVQYLANPMMTNVEFAFCNIGQKFTDATVTSGFGPVTFATSHMQMNNISFNEVCQAMVAASGTTTMTGNLTNVILFSNTVTSPVAGQCANQSPAGTNPAAFALQLNSDNVDLWINGLAAGFVQGLALIGGGSAGPSHGQLHIRGMEVSAYSNYANGTPALLTDNTGSTLDLDFRNLVYIFPPASFTPGAKLSGIGAGYVVGGLPPCNAANKYLQLPVRDANAPTYGGTLAGGGTGLAVGWCDGTNWTAH